MRSLLVVIGMTLFALGFIFTLKALPTGSETLGSSDAASASSSPSWLLIVGFVVSLSGIALATVAPAAMFMRARKSKG